MGGKWLELLKEIAPHVNRATFLFNPVTGPHFEYYLGAFKAAAASLAVQPILTPVRDPSELESAIAAQAREANSDFARKILAGCRPAPVQGVAHTTAPFDEHKTRRP